MRPRPSSRLLCLAVLIMFLVNLAAWGFSTTRLAHELGHGAYAAAAAAAAADAHAQAVPSGIETGDDTARTAVEHQAVHAVDHMQLFPDTSSSVSFAPAPAGQSTAMFLARPLPPARLDQPFRPPRSTA